jgi:hypothetical protein|tara:strand:- start:781 stop:1020 length:240 start_codon:yes stop_codon:yes gene_type:complete
MKYTYPPNEEDPGYKREMERGDTVCYKGDRTALAVIGQVGTVDYGQGRVDKRASVIWITGPKVGKKQMYDVRDLVKVEE